MAEKAEKPKDAAEGGDGKAKKSPIWTKTPVLVTAIMVVEAGVLIGLFKVLGGGGAKPVAADVTLATEGGHGEHASTQTGTLVEIPTLSERFPNVISGRRYLYDVAIVALVKAENKALIEEVFRSRESMIKDRVRTIIAQSDPSKLGGGDEPGLETLRRQVKHQLEEITGREGLIEEILIPRCIPFRVD